MVFRVETSAESGSDGFEVSEARYVQEGAAHRNITADIIDRAVEDTFRDADVPEGTRSVMREMLAVDSSSSVAQAYYSGLAAGGGTPVRPVTEKIKLNIPYLLSEREVSLISSYASDFQLRFYDSDNHDHPLAAACRLVDRKIIYDRIPSNVTISDLGGAIIPLINGGRLGRTVHTCAPIVDPKDPSRRTMVKMRAKMIASDETKPFPVRNAARAYLAADPRAICDSIAQDCTYRTHAITSIHVYDIPMQDWSKIMHNKSAELVEGCLLFPEGIFDRAAGEMESAGARYECDALTNTFKMGFIGSPSWWYSHKLSDYLKYGVDQVLYYGNAVYSYKVVERRGDTLFFRILKVARSAAPNPYQYFRVPGVSMVLVDGFSLSTRAADMQRGARAKYMFPAILWSDMLGYAKDCAERNTLTQEALFNYYRTVAPRQSINSVIVSGGVEVTEMRELLPLIVHVALFALMEIARSKMETTAMTASIVHQRAVDEEGTWYKIGKAMAATLLGSFKLFFYPFYVMSNSLQEHVTNRLLQNSYEWTARPEVVQVSAKLLIGGCFSEDTQVTANDSLLEYMGAGEADQFLEAMAGDPETARLALELFGETLEYDTRDRLIEVLQDEEQQPEETQVVVHRQSSVSTVTPSLPTPRYVTSNHAPSGAVSMSTEHLVPDEEIQRRRDSILEAIVESEAESNKCEAACAIQFTVMTSGGSPLPKKIRDHNEEFGNPEFWYIESGILQQSLTGLDPVGFEHAAIYIPKVMEGTRLYRVYEEDFEGRSAGEYIKRTHVRVEQDYTGWGLVNDSLRIYNGPSVVETMREALDRQMDFVVELCQGPPGCGKTTAIVNRVDVDDVVLVPVRKAAKETAERVLKVKGEGFKAMAKTRIRTLDSYLVNYRGNSKLRSMHTYRLLADEAFMAREGRWLAAAALLGARRVYAYGDKNQIPHVPRAECPKSYVSLAYQSVDATYISYRCPPQLVACWSHVFEHKVRSASNEVGDVKQVASAGKLTIPKGCVMMGMYQADKKELEKKYKGCGVDIKIMTVHESQGNTYEHVWLHRFDLRKRNDKFSLYDKPPYVLVAMSRSTKSFVYVAPPSIGDCVTHWIEMGKDPRRINAVSDKDSAGQSIEFV